MSTVSATDALALWIGLAFFATSYVIAAACLQVVAQKAGAQNSWFAWVPFLNAYLMLRVAKRSGWWLLLFLIPVVNLVVGLIVGVGVAHAMKRSGVWGVLLWIPFISLIAWIYLAASPPPAIDAAETKTCPACAETIKEAARVCRYCGYEFAEAARAATGVPHPPPASQEVSDTVEPDEPDAAKLPAATPSSDGSGPRRRLSWLIAGVAVLVIGGVIGAVLLIEKNQRSEATAGATTKTASSNEETPAPAPKKKRRNRVPPDHPHGIAPIDTAFATLANLGLWDPERLNDATCFGEGRQKHWYCEVTRNGRVKRYTIHVRPDLGTMSWLTNGDSPRAPVKRSPHTAVLEGITHSHGEGSFQVVERTMTEYGLDRIPYECWAGADLSAHWKCRDELGSVYTIHITPEGTPTNYITDGWDPTTNITGVNE